MDNYKGANMTISTNCKNVSELLLVKIDPKKVYENMEFDEDQVQNQ